MALHTKSHTFSEPRLGLGRRSGHAHTHVTIMLALLAIRVPRLPSEMGLYIVDVFNVLVLYDKMCYIALNGNGCNFCYVVRFNEGGKILNYTVTYNSLVGTGHIRYV